jgi:formate hydrogenlyase subunit 5
MKLPDVLRTIDSRWSGKAHAASFGIGKLCEIECAHEILPELCGWLCNQADYFWSGLIVEENPANWELRYGFYGQAQGAHIHLIAHRPIDMPTFPSIAIPVHAADWHEREVEDLFGIVFEGHPRLGDFVLHDDVWEEGAQPMRHSFEASRRAGQPNPNWRPHRVLQDPGAFAMTVGPVFSGAEESVHFLLETVGEDVTRTIQRLFYKYRGVEKIAEGRNFADALLLAERFAATTAFSHALAFCQAVEEICRVGVTERALRLRVFFSELERFRHHVGTIEAICESTALAVAAAQAGILEERLLRITGALTGHRYLFGLCVPGGLSKDLDTDQCRKALEAVKQIYRQLEELGSLLKFSSSFLDRLEEVGTVSQENAREIGLVGPVARASAVVRDLRQAQPYSGYDAFKFEVPSEEEGDGYARLRVLFGECLQSLRLMEQCLEGIDGAPVRMAIPIRPGATLAWSETPRGAAFHWVRLTDEGKVARYRIVPPSFANWLGFHLAAENFAFQDFPIILATFNLSVAENDR